MIVFPTCKINLGLRVPSKRQDGYHNIETIFYPIQLTDALEVIRQTDPIQQTITFSFSGLPINGKEDDNLCIKAYYLLKENFPELPPIQAHLHKIIPMGAGLGGGSSDGAFMLRMLNDLFSLQLPDEKLCEYALKLGSDCPFFIYNSPCYAEGRGELLEPISLSLKNYKIVLVYPALHVSTAKAFSELNRNSAPIVYSDSLKDIIRLPVVEWKDKLVNEFEVPVINQFPEIAEIKSTLYDAGALFVSMTGSGSTVYALFEKTATPVLKFSESYFFRIIEDLI
jgi:4-diphosphocytidyl-2-C-methyl-D-erythritol kinase